MLFKFTMPPDALEPFTKDLGLMRAAHEHSLRALQQYGVMVKGDGYPQGDLMAKIADLPQTTRLLWQEALENIRQLNGPQSSVDVLEAYSSTELNAVRGEVHLLCTNPLQAEALGVPEGEVSHFHQMSEVEVARIDGVGVSKIVKTSEALTKAPVAVGTTADDLWQQRFQLLASVSRTVVIVDGYAAGRHYKHQNTSELMNFLLHLDRDGRNVVVKIIASFSSDKRNYQIPTREQIIEGLQNASGRMARGGVREIQVCLLENGEFVETIHDRWIRFDQVEISLGSGLEPFGVGGLTRSCTFSMYPFPDEHDVDERSALSAAAHSGFPIITL